MNANPTIIAEISCNHLGSLDRALELILMARYVGADAVKLQCWSQSQMVADPTYKIEAGTWAGRNLYDLYQEAWTPWEWFPTLFDYARSIGIECFSSVFDVSALAYLEFLRCPRYKIASFEIVDLPLIRAVVRTGKPIIISTGMASREEIGSAWDEATQADNDVTILKCTSAYPASAASANLATMERFQSHRVKCGVSDHTLGLVVPIAATALGATMIEKHLTLKRADGGPDAAFSSEPEEFRAMVHTCREAAHARGIVRYGPTEEEESSLQFRRSLYWAQDVVEGELIKRKHFQSSRPALGLPPVAADRLVGSPAKLAAKRGQPVTMEWL